MDQMDPSIPVRPSRLASCGYDQNAQDATAATRMTPIATSASAWQLHRAPYSPPIGPYKDINRDNNTVCIGCFNKGIALKSRLLPL